MSTSFYLPTSEQGTFTATASTVGPWGPGLQHGGPPSALLAREVERAPGSWPFTVVRLAIEILGPVPVGELSVASHIARSGKSVELVEAELSAGGRVAVRARGWRIRATELDLPPGVAAATDHPEFPAQNSTAETWPGGFLQSMDVRFATGGWTVPGPATAWARLKIGLVDGEELTPLQRLMTLADCGNGISSSLPIPAWVFINPDLTVHLSRYPAGEWMCIDAVTTVDPSGFGLAASTLYDLNGPVGHGAQSLFIDHTE